MIQIFQMYIQHKFLLLNYCYMSGDTRRISCDTRRISCDRFPPSLLLDNHYKMRRLENSPARFRPHVDPDSLDNSPKNRRAEIFRSLNSKLELIEDKIQNVQNSIALYEHDISMLEKSLASEIKLHQTVPQPPQAQLKRLLQRAITLDEKMDTLDEDLVILGYPSFYSNGLRDTISLIEEKIAYNAEHEHLKNQLYKKEQKLSILRAQRNEVLLRISIRHL